jgi:hypothetical protein
MSEENYSSFIRWQDNRIKQFGFVNNLFIALSSGFLILEAQSIIGETTLLPCEAFFIGISTIYVFASLIVGGILAINRLLAFRYTAQIARKRETKNREGLSDLRNQTDDIDQCSWILLWFQTGLFGLGSIFLVVMVILKLILLVCTKYV